MAGGEAEMPERIGGDLVWLASKEEHRTVASFYRKNSDKPSCYNSYLGLHRNDNGALELSLIHI